MLTGNKNLDMEILNRLEDRDLVNICLVNQYTNQLCQNKYFWINRIKKKFPYLDLEIMKKYKKDRSWADYYIHDLRRFAVFANQKPKIPLGSVTGRLDQLIIELHRQNRLNAKGLGNFWILHNAAKYGHLDIVKFLVENNVDIHKFDDDAFVIAVENNHPNIVEFLLDHGADSTTQNNKPLQIAVENNYSDIIYLLLNN